MTEDDFWAELAEEAEKTAEALEESFGAEQEGGNSGGDGGGGKGGTEPQNGFERLAEEAEETLEAIEGEFGPEPEEMTAGPGAEEVEEPVTLTIDRGEFRTSVKETAEMISELREEIAEQAGEQQVGELLPDPTEASEDAVDKAVRLIRNTNPDTIVEKTPAEGKVQATMFAENVDEPDPDAFENDLEQIRSLDAKLETLDEQTSQVKGAQKTVIQRISNLESDVERLEDALEDEPAPEKVQEIYNKLTNAESRIDELTEVAELANEKLVGLDERTDDILNDRNTLRGEVKALYRAAMMSGNEDLMEQFNKIWGQKKIRKPLNVPHRHTSTRRILKTLKDFGRTDDLPVPKDTLINRTAGLFETGERDWEEAVNLLLATGELRATDEGITWGYLVQ